MVESTLAPGAIAPPEARPTRWRWLAPLLLLLAAGVEVLSMLVMTVFRYHNQLLPVELFDLSKRANVLGLLLAAPFVVLFLLQAAVPALRTPGRAILAIVASSTGLLMLLTSSLLVGDEQAYLYAGYLALKAIAFATFVVLLRERHAAAWRSAVAAVLLMITLSIVGFLVVISTVLLSPIGSEIIDQPRKEYDAAVILGAAVWSRDRPSPVLRERIRAGYNLLEHDYVRFLVLTGGSAPYELPEAEVARRELLKLGVDPTRILMETKTGSTTGQILFIRDNLLKQGWTSFIIVSDQFHLKRALEIARFNELDAHGVSSESPLGPQNLVLYHVRESVALILYWMYGV